MKRWFGGARPEPLGVWADRNSVAPHVLAELKQRGYSTADDVRNIEADEIDHLRLERADKDMLRCVLLNEKTSKSEAMWNYTKDFMHRAGSSLQGLNKATSDLITHGKTRVKELPEDAAVTWYDQEVEEVDDHEGESSTSIVNRQASLPPDIGSKLDLDSGNMSGDSLRCESGSAHSVADLPHFSTLVRDGVVSHYRLHTAAKQLNTPHVRWHTFGLPRSGVPGRCCLLLGETGAGKTCLVDAFFNHLLGVRATDGKLYHATNELNKRLTLSATRYSTAYTLYPLDGAPCQVPFTVIDTPGLGQSGAEKDGQLLKEVSSLLQAPGKLGLPRVDVLYLVIQGTRTHLSAASHHFLSSMLPCLTSSTQQVQVAFTFSDGSTAGAYEALRQMSVQFSHSYHLNNCGLTDTGLSTVHRLFMEQNARSMDAMLHNFPASS